MVQDGLFDQTILTILQWRWSLLSSPVLFNSGSLKYFLGWQPKKVPVFFLALKFFCSLSAEVFAPISVSISVREGQALGPLNAISCTADGTHDVSDVDLDHVGCWLIHAPRTPSPAGADEGERRQAEVACECRAMWHRGGRRGERHHICAPRAAALELCGLPGKPRYPLDFLLCGSLIVCEGHEVHPPHRAQMHGMKVRSADES